MFKGIYKIFMAAGQNSVKIIAAVMLIVLKILNIFRLIISDIFKAVFSLFKYIYTSAATSFKKRVKLTEELIYSVKAAKKQRSGTKYAMTVFERISSYLFKEDGVFYTVFNYVLPILSVAFFISVISYGSSLEYGICVEYNGKELGIIQNESQFNTAVKDVTQRLSFVSGEDVTDFKPTMSLRIVSEDDEILNGTQLVSKLLEQSPHDLAEAYGIYIDGEFAGAVVEKAPIEKALTETLINYKIEGFQVKNISFQKKVTYQYGTYLKDSVMDEKDAISMMTASKKTRTLYTLQEGETAASVCQKYNMSIENFYLLNNRAAEESLQEGDVVVIVMTSSFLPIQYTREFETVAFIKYETTEVETSSLNVGAREVLTMGQRGEKVCKFEIMYVDGIERSRIVTNSTVTKEPVVEVIGIGTYLAKPASADTKLYGTGQFSWPVDGGYVSDTFNSMIELRDGRAHKGMDIAAPAGTDIYAAAEGVVVEAGWNPGGYGYFVMIDHLNGYETVYGHCSMLYVVKGQTVSRGQLIAGVGNTGNSYGNHLHFEVRIMGLFSDPALYINTVKYGDD